MYENQEKCKNPGYGTAVLLDTPLRAGPGSDYWKSVFEMPMFYVLGMMHCGSPSTSSGCFVILLEWLPKASGDLRSEMTGAACKWEVVRGSLVILPSSHFRFYGDGSCVCPRMRLWDSNRLDGWLCRDSNTHLFLVNWAVSTERVRANFPCAKPHICFLVWLYKLLST